MPRRSSSRRRPAAAAAAKSSTSTACPAQAPWAASALGRARRRAQPPKSQQQGQSQQQLQHHLPRVQPNRRRMYRLQTWQSRWPARPQQRQGAPPKQVASARRHARNSSWHVYMSSRALLEAYFIKIVAGSQQPCRTFQVLFSTSRTHRRFPQPGSRLQAAGCRLQAGSLQPGSRQQAAGSRQQAAGSRLRHRQRVRLSWGVSSAPYLLQPLGEWAKSRSSVMCVVRSYCRAW